MNGPVAGSLVLVLDGLGIGFGAVWLHAAVRSIRRAFDQTREILTEQHDQLLL